MSFLTKYGTLWGAIPATAGRVFWVAAAASYTVTGRSYVASDDNDGLSPERAKLTLASAITDATANVGDIIVLLPGAHSWSASAAVSKAGITIMGLPRAGYAHVSDRLPATGTRNVASVTTSASDEAINVTAADVEIAYLHFIPVAGFAAVDFTDAADRLHVHDCTWNMTTAENTATMGIFCRSAADNIIVSRCYAYVVGNQGPFFRSVGGPVGSVIQNSTVQLEGATSWDDVIEITTGATGLIIRDCDFTSDPAVVLTDVVDVTGNTTDGDVQIIGCRIPVGADLAQGTATADYTLLNNYIATASGGTGGTLQTD